MKYAAVYLVAERDIHEPRRCEAATRIAAYMLRRAAHRDRRQVTGNITVSVGTPSGYFPAEPKDYAIRVEAATVPT